VGQRGGHEEYFEITRLDHWGDNYEMELTAAIKALKRVNGSCARVKIGYGKNVVYSDALRN
jgi:ribonuclease HI